MINIEPLAAIIAIIVIASVFVFFIRKELN